MSKIKKISKWFFPPVLFVGVFAYQVFSHATPSHFNPGTQWQSAATFWPTLMETWNWHGDEEVATSLLTHDHVHSSQQPTPANLEKFMADFKSARQDLNLLTGTTAWKLQKTNLRAQGNCQHLHLEGNYKDARGAIEDFVEEHAYCGEKLRMLSVIAPHTSKFWKTADVKNVTDHFLATAGTGN